MTAQDEIHTWWTTWRRVRKGRPVGEAEPYRGLRSFGADDAEWFFGRQDLSAELLRKAEKLHIEGGGVLLVVGASGSGKTSLINAGFLAALRGGALPGSAQWPVLTIAVAQHPVADLGPGARR